jgi:hypothetical protein
MKWLWKNSIPLSSVVVSAFKDGKCVFIAAHSREFKNEIASIIESIVKERLIIVHCVSIRSAGAIKLRWVLAS